MATGNVKGLSKEELEVLALELSSVMPPMHALQDDDVQIKKPESVRTDPETYGAEPVHGNYTTDAHLHLWCANGLSKFVGNGEVTFDELNDDIQAAIRYLLSCEIGRAMNAQAAEQAADQARRAA